MDEVTGSDERPMYRESADDPSQRLPEGSSQSERVAMRLDLIEKNGLLVIGRGSGRTYIGRIVGSVALGLLGLLVLVMGADGFAGFSGFLLFILFGVVFPIFIVKRHHQDHSLELTPKDFSLTRRGRHGAETLHRASWANVTSVTTVKFGNRPESPSFPAVNVVAASGIGRRSKIRTFFTRELRGEKIVLNQPLAVGRWELVALLTDAHRRFAPKPDSARE